MTKDIEISDDGLVARMVTGDEDAFVLLYRRRQGSVFRFVLHMCGNRAIAEDVTQEVFLALIRDARRFDPNRGSLGAFLVGIARNHVKKRWEQDRRLVIVGDASSDGLERAITKEGFGGVGEYQAADGRMEQAASELIAMDQVDMVRKVIATLPEKYREVVVLCDLQEMSYEKAAASLGCPVGTVRSRLHRARAMLLEKFREKKSYLRAAESRSVGSKETLWNRPLSKAREGAL
jgi:RNA polymerase sigma-70 factor, ECF subfamily